jgi:capsular polysaccharide transport system permease protein
MMLASVVTLLHALAGGRDHSGMSPYTFTLTGYAILLFSAILSIERSRFLHTSASMLYHSMITPFDLVLSVAVVDMLGCISAMAFLQGFAIVLGLAEMPFRLLDLLLSICLLAWFSLSLSLISAAYCYSSPLLGRLVHPFSYFSMPLSGAFFTMTFSCPIGLVSTCHGIR